MKVVYTVEMAAKKSVRDDLEKTVKAIEDFGVTSYSVGDEVCSGEYCSAFVEVEVDGGWGKHVEFAKRFAPTVVEPFEGIEISGKDFFEPIMRMVAQSRVLLRGHGIRVPYSNFTGPKRLPRDEVERLILEGRKYRVNIVLSVALRNPSIILGAVERAGVVNDYLVRGNMVGVDFIGDLGNIVMLLLYFLPVAVEPVEPVEYDLNVQEVGDVLMVVAERSREIVGTIIKERGL